MPVTVATVLVLDAVMLVLADQPGDNWPVWIAIPANLFAVALMGWGWWRGELIRKPAHEAEVAQVRQLAAQQVAGAEQLAEERKAGVERELAQVLRRMDAVVADRDAWRVAHSAEVDARREAEQAAAKIVEAQGVTVRLLSALEAIMAGRQVPPPSTG